MQSESRVIWSSQFCRRHLKFNTSRYFKANISTIDQCHIVQKARCLHEEYNGSKKSKSRTTGQAAENRVNFIASLNNLLDVAHRDAMSMIKIKEVGEFLEAQMKPGRRGRWAVWIGPE